MTVRIVTDSTCDLPAEIIAQYGIRVVPLYIRVGVRDYLDGVDMSREEFYNNLPTFPEHPKTAVPSPIKFRSMYDSLVDEGATEVLSIHISKSLSATVDVARTAAGETTSVPVTVFDSGQLSMGTGFMVYTAALLAEKGYTAAQIVTELEKQGKRTHVSALLDTLLYLRRSGRMSHVMSTIGEILQIKPILKMYDGVSAAERVRTRKNGLARLIAMIREFGPFERIAFLHSNAMNEAKALQAAVKDLLPDTDVWFGVINPVLGSHIGTGVVGFAAISKE